jgi:hypothetical protein
MVDANGPQGNGHSIVAQASRLYVSVQAKVTSSSNSRAGRPCHDQSGRFISKRSDVRQYQFGLAMRPMT